jgi:hypothetical protein
MHTLTLYQKVVDYDEEIIKMSKETEDKKVIDSRDRDHTHDHEPRRTVETIRRAREMMNAGPLAVPSHYLEPGKRYYMARPDEIAQCEQLGYDVVYRKDIHIGDQSLNRGHGLERSTIGVKLGKDKDGRSIEGTLMEITEEFWQANQDVEREKVRQIEEDIGKPVDGMTSTIFKKIDF